VQSWPPDSRQNGSSHSPLGPLAILLATIFATPPPSSKGYTNCRQVPPRSLPFSNNESRKVRFRSPRKDTPTAGRCLFVFAHYFQRSNRTSSMNIRSIPFSNIGSLEVRLDLLKEGFALLGRRLQAGASQEPSLLQLWISLNKVPLSSQGYTDCRQVPCRCP
jgi:hypothetical protein